MSITNEALDLAQQRNGINSDYGMAKFLGVSKQAISNYRNNRRNLDDPTALLVAKAAKIDPVDLLASLHRERASNDIDSQIWEKIEKQNETFKLLNSKEYKEALTALLQGKATAKQKSLIKKTSEQCILCKIGIISKTATFSPIYLNTPKKHLN